MSDKRPVPIWLTIVAPIIVICSVSAIAYPIYQNRNITPYERDTAQYDGWMYAEWNNLRKIGQCENTDGGWAALGIDTSTAFLEGCRAAIRSQ